MNLEDLRQDDLGQVFFSLDWPNESPETMVAITFHEHANRAFYLTLRAIRDLENSNGLHRPGESSLLAAGSWFIAIEAYLNTILRFLIALEGKGVDPHQKRDLTYRTDDLFTRLAIDRRTLYRSRAYQRFEEFKAFRNEVFHDRAFQRDMKFAYTAFSPRPTRANQVDAVEGLLVATGIFHALRAVIPRFDLMPSIAIKKGESYGFLRLDALSNTVVLPYFKLALDKHGLSSTIGAQHLDEPLPVAGHLATQKTRAVMRATPTVLKAMATTERTQFGEKLLEEAADSIQMDDRTQFQVPSYEVAPPL